MATIADITLENARARQREFNQRGSVVVRQCGEEHTGQATSGIATVYLSTDPQMAYISQLDFKFIVGNPEGESVPQFDPQYESHIDPVDVTGAYTSVTAFYDLHLGRKVDMDGAYGAQCWDLADIFWEKQAGRRLITRPGGNGTAAMCWTVSKEQNRTDSTGRVVFDLITNWANIRPGDWLVFSGPYSTGHITMALETPESATATIRCLGQNQRNASATAGSAASVDKFTPAYFLGAFRWMGNWDSSSPYDSTNNRPILA